MEDHLSNGFPVGDEFASYPVALLHRPRNLQGGWSVIVGHYWLIWMSVLPNRWESGSVLSWKNCCTRCCIKGAQEPRHASKLKNPTQLHNNTHEVGSLRNRQVIGSSPIVGPRHNPFGWARFESRRCIPNPVFALCGFGWKCWPHSYRSATMGSTPMARRAGR